MFDGLKRQLAVSILGSALKSLTTNKDIQTTIGGLLAAAVLAVPGFDLGKLLSGDWGQIAHVAAALVVFLIGYWSTKANADGKTTAAGAFSGALYAMSGNISALVTGLVIFWGGYQTNKPVVVIPPPANPDGGYPPIPRPLIPMPSPPAPPVFPRTRP